MKKNLVKKVKLNAEKNEKIIKILMNSELISKPHNELLLKTSRIKEYINNFSNITTQYENIISQCSELPLSKFEELEILLEKKDWMYTSLKNISEFIELETNSLDSYITKNIEQNKLKNYSTTPRDNTWID